MVINPSLSFGSSSAYSYEGDADDDSFESCSGGAQKTELPIFDSSSEKNRSELLKEINERMMSPASSLAYSVESEDDDSCDHNSPSGHLGSYNDCKNVSTLIESPNLVVNHSFVEGETTYDQSLILSGKDLQTHDNHSTKILHHNDFSLQKQKAMSGLNSLASTTDTKTTMEESIGSPNSSSTSSPTSSILLASPSLRFKRSSDGNEEPFCSFSAPAKTTRCRVHSPNSAVTLLPSFVSTRENLPSPPQLHKERGLSFQTILSLNRKCSRNPPDGSNSDSISSAPRSSRVQAMKARLRLLEAEHRQNSEKTLGKEEIKIQRVSEKKSPFTQPRSQDMTLKIAREVMAFTFTAFIIYLGYLSYHDAQSNALQVQVTQSRFLEDSLVLSNESRIRSLEMQRELVHLLDQTLATLQKEREESVSLLQQIPTPSPVKEHVQVSPTAGAHDEKIDITSGRAKRTKIPMYEFYIVQSLFDY